MRYTITVITLGVLFSSTTASGQDLTRNVFDECIVPLGMEEGKIPDDAITASSSYETKSVGPQNARIRQEKNGGAWCPKAQISNTIREYLEIDLTRNHLIAWTETQGRFGNGQGQEYAEAFFLEYWRDGKWHQYQDLRGDRVGVRDKSTQEVLRGNSNTYLVEKQKLELPFIANKVRFVPYSQHPRTVCMRVEIYGCVWQQYVRSYSAPKGSSLGPGGSNVQDSSYDGIEELDSILANGLGQLTDGILGEVSEILDSPGTGTNWVGWSECATVQIIFRFQQLREFDNCSIHVARMPQLEVETFSMLRISFSIDGANYEPEIEKLAPSIDTSSSIADTVSVFIHLQSKIGCLVKMEFTLAAKWLLLSEITFYTGSKDRSNDSYISEDRSLRTDRNQSESEAKSSGSSLDSMISGFNETKIYKIHEDTSTPDAFPVGTSQTYIGLVSGLLTVFVLFLTCTAFLIKQRGRNKIALLHKHTALLCDSSVPSIAITPKDVKLSNSIVNGLSLIRKPIAIAVSNNLPLRSATDTQIDSQIAFVDSNYPRRSTLYEKTYNLFKEDNLELAQSNASAGRAVESSCADFKCSSSFTINKTTEFTVPTTSTYSSKRTFHLQSGKLNQNVQEGYYAATDVLTIKLKRELPSTLSPFTPLHIREKGIRLPRAIGTCNIQCFSRHRLRILDKLGEGNFGLVHLCEAKGIANPEAGMIEKQQIVIVRSLWRGVVDSLRLDFTSDMRILAMLRNSNVAKMIALIEEEPFGAVFEYGRFGDLPSFLESRRSSDTEDNIGCTSRLNFLIQIASGMKYLESMNIAHCDLAARNCIVDHNLTIKVSDHAIYCNKYDHHYFINGHNAKIPLRWMAWEAVLLEKRSCRADVWSFAVTVWEIFMNCKEIPYAELTVAQVLENYAHWYQSEMCNDNTRNNNNNNNNNERNQPRIPSRPDRCPNDLYRMMNKCWSKRIEDRPYFHEIYLFLKKLVLD